MALRSELEKQGEFLFKYRSYLPLIVLLMALGVAYINYQFSSINGTNANVITVIALGIGLLGLGVRVFTVGYTPANTSGRNTSGQLADELNTTGFYSMVRHPLYLGNFLMWLSPAILTFHAWFVLLFIVVYWLYYERIMMAEERFLIEKFGQQYLSWAKSVPPFLPQKLEWKKPPYPFSWKKILKKEKNGLFALFALFFLFKLIDLFVQHKVDTYYFNWQFYGFLITGLIYFLLKIMKYRGIFDEKDR
jgi:protein-S-isoprenylcysteine O-methyltransferase Ste14